MAKARLETVITGDESPFVQSVNRAERRAQTFSSKLQTLFRRDPSARAQRAIGGFVGDLASGNVESAITGIAGRLHGVGLAAGVGIGAAIIVFKQAKDQLDAVDKSVEKLNFDLARPLATQSALGVEGIGKELESTGKDLDEVVEKRKGLFQKIREAATLGQPDTFNTTTLQVEKPNRVPEALRSQERGFKRIHDLRQSQVAAEEKITQTRETGLQVSEREGELAKIQSDADEKRAALRLKFGGDPREAANLHKELTNVTRNEKLSRQESERKFDVKQRELETEKAIAEIKSLHLPKDREAVDIAQRHLDSLTQEQGFAPTSEARAAFGGKIIDAKTALHATQFAAADQSPDAVRARNASNLDDLRRRAFDTNITQMSNPNRSAYGGIVSGLGAVGPQQSTNVGETRQQGESSISGLKSSIDALTDVARKLVE